MNGVYLTTAGRIRQELTEIEQIVQRIEAIWLLSEASTHAYYLDAVALNLHSFYTGVERIFEVIADRIDQAKPGGTRWHQQLIRQMAAEVPQIRPTVLSRQTCEQLDRYRGFRHVVRNIYTFKFDSRQIEPLIDNLQSMWVAIRQELLQFAQFLEQSAG